MPVPIDAAPVALDCPTYCTEIQANCTGANAQYPDMTQCTATCASFTVGTSKVTDPSGNTLGCRIYHGGAASMTAAATHCVHAGPGGDLITVAPPAFCSGGGIGCRSAHIRNENRDQIGSQVIEIIEPKFRTISCGSFVIRPTD